MQEGSSDKTVTSVRLAMTFNLFTAIEADSRAASICAAPTIDRRKTISDEPVVDNEYQSSGLITVDSGATRPSLSTLQTAGKTSVTHEGQVPGLLDETLHHQDFPYVWLSVEDRQNPIEWIRKYVESRLKSN